MVTNGFQTKPAREATGGDGAFCFVDQDNPNIVLTAYTNNVVYLSTDGGNSFSEIISDALSGEFINPSEYDSQSNVFYSYKQSTPSKRMYRVRNVGTTNNVDTNVSVAYTGTSVSALKMSPNTSNVLFFGTDQGYVYRVSNAHTGNWTATQIGSGALATGTISSIDVGGTDDKVLVTISNYGVNSVFETTNASSNGTATWTNKDNATLPDMPIRWGIYNRGNFNQVLLATEAGIYSTDDLNAVSPTWGPTSTGLANVRCDMLKYRTSDKVVVVGTHGRGIYTTDAFVTAPYADFETDRNGGCLPNVAINFTDGSLRATSWAWDVDGNGTTDYTTQNPSHVYTTAGTYTVQLSINGGVSTKTKQIVIGNTLTAAACTPSNANNNGNGFGIGIFRVAVGDIDNTTPNNDGAYNDYTCSMVTKLTAGTITNITVQTGNLNSEGATVYIDYNNDGDFADTGETILSVANDLTGTKTSSFTPPTTGITFNTLLRMRVISDFNTSPVAACTFPQGYGQAEDYGILIVRPPITWTGTTSSAWTTTSNWSGNVVPTSVDDVIIPSGTPNSPLVTSTVSCNGLEIQNSATLSIGNSGVINKGGTFTNNGTVRLAGSTLQTFPSFMTSFNNITIDNAAGTYLSQNISVSGTLTIQNGNLNMLGKNINLGITGAISEDRPNNKVIFDSPNGSTAKITATGRVVNNTYTNIAGLGIELNRGSAGSLTVTVERGNRPNTVTTNIQSIKKTFAITTTAGSVTNGSMRIYYASSEANGLVTGEAQLWKYSASTWSAQGGTYNANSGNPYVEVTNAINSFSTWTLANTSTPMPVVLISFDGKRQDAETVALQWKTGQEINNKGFEVERSLDIVTFEKIAFVEGSGSSNEPKTYSYSDKFNEGAYYRLKQTDFSGRFSYSPVIFVEGNEPEIWNIYPNPTIGEVKIKIPRKALSQDFIKIRILNTMGQQVATIEALPTQIEQELSQALLKLSKGTYLVEGQNTTERWQQKLIKK